MEFDYFETAVLGNAYWTEIDEMEAGTHPTQVKSRIEEALRRDNIPYGEITYLEWNFEGSRVEVSLDYERYGIFNYETNKFEIIYRGDVSNDKNNRNECYV